MKAHPLSPRLAALLAGLLGIALLSGCSKTGNTTAQNRPAAVEIAAARAEERQVERKVEVVGSLMADEEVQVSNDSAAFLETVYVDFGDQVKQGQVLAELDKREYALKLEEARAARAQARAALEDARSKYESAKQLVKTGDIPQQRFTEVEQSYQAQLARVEGSQAQLALLEKQLKDATMRAPFSGTVSAKLISAGQYVKDKTPILSLVKDSVLRLRARVPEVGAGAARKGMGVTFTTDAHPGRSFTGTISEVAPVLDPQSRTLMVEAKVPNPQRLLKPGMFARVTVVTEKNAPAVMVPRPAVYEFAGLTKVFVVQGDRVVERRVELGVAQQDLVEVRGAEIKPGDLVAVSRLAELQDGEQVKVAERPSVAAKQPAGDK